MLIRFKFLRVDADHSCDVLYSKSSDVKELYHILSF
jgi:hypothetical protein